MYQKDLRVFGAKVGCLSVQCVISECFFYVFFASGSTSDWRLYYPGMALMKDTDGSD